MSKLSLQTKHNIFHYRTGAHLHQKHAVRSKKSNSLQYPFCQQADSSFHALSGFQHTIILGMINERLYDPCRLIMKVISKGSLADCLVHLVAGSTDRFAQQKPSNAWAC